MPSLFKIKRFIITLIALGMYFVPNYTFALEEISEKEIMEAPITDATAQADSSLYINDIEILGSNIIKPEFILSKMTLKVFENFANIIKINIPERM